jgi:hypothetical protein
MVVLGVLASGVEADGFPVALGVVLRRDETLNLQENLSS